MVNLCSIYACICATLHVSCMSAFIFAAMFACMHVFMLLRLFCNYCRLCVDVGTHVATS